VTGYLVARDVVGGAREYADGLAGWTLGRSSAFHFTEPSHRLRRDLSPREWAAEHAVTMTKLYGCRCFVVRLVRKKRAA
jgi:hypothetical protein